MKYSIETFTIHLGSFNCCYWFVVSKGKIINRWESACRKPIFNLAHTGIHSKRQKATQIKPCLGDAIAINSLAAKSTAFATNSEA